MTKAEKIAKGLTEAQREAMKRFCIDRGFFVPDRREFFYGVEALKNGFTVPHTIAKNTVNSLLRKELIFIRSDRSEGKFCAVTPLGLAVKEALERMEG